MNVIMSQIIYKNDNKKMERVVNNFRSIVEKILEENKEIFDEENFTIAQRQALLPFLLFVAQETSRTLIITIIFILSKFHNANKNNDNVSNRDLIVNAIFNVSLANATPFHGIARILKHDIMITNKRTNKTEYYDAGCVIGPLPAQLSKLDLKKNIKKYEHYVPFGIGKHHCPGEDFVLKQGKLLIKYLLSNYKMKTDVNEIKFVQLMTQRISTQFLTSFTKIK